MQNVWRHKFAFARNTVTCAFIRLRWLDNRRQLCRRKCVPMIQSLRKPSENLRKPDGTDHKSDLGRSKGKWAGEKGGERIAARERSGIGGPRFDILWWVAVDMERSFWFVTVFRRFDEWSVYKPNFPYNICSKPSNGMQWILFHMNCFFSARLSLPLTLSLSLSLRVSLVPVMPSNQSCSVSSFCFLTAFCLHHLLTGCNGKRYPSAIYNPHFISQLFGIRCICVSNCVYLPY